MSQLVGVTSERCYQFIRLPPRTDFGVQCEDLGQLGYNPDILNLVKPGLMTAQNSGGRVQLLTHRREGLDQRGDVQPIILGGPPTDDLPQAAVNLIGIGRAELRGRAQFDQYRSKIRLTPDRGGHRCTAGRKSRHAATMAFVEAVSIGNCSDGCFTPGNRHQ